MVFRRKSRKVVVLDFEYEEKNQTKNLHFEIKHTERLADTLLKISSEIEDNLDIDVKTMSNKLIEIYDEILGAGSMAMIKEKVYENDDLLITDLLDIGNYIVAQVDKVNKEIEEKYGTISKQTKQKQQFYTIEDVNFNKANGNDTIIH